MKKKVVIATHVYSFGTSQALRDYLKGKAEILFIGHPIIGNLFTWTWAAFATFFKVLLSGKKFDLYMGSNPVNAFIGILLKKIGRVKKVIFYAPDLPPKRFENKIMNAFYHKLDLFCTKYADSVWNNSDLMIREREKKGLSRKYRQKQIEVPMGSHLLKATPFAKIDRYLIGFSGHLSWDKGLELIIEAMPEVIKKIPKVKLLIIGSGPMEKKLKSMIKKLGLKNVKFAGYVPDLKKVYKKLSSCAIAVAPYPPSANVTWTDPAKAKMYFSAGLPVIITDAPKLAKEIHKKRAGIMIKYNHQELIKAVVKLLRDEKTLKTYRKNVRKLAQKYSYDRIFTKAMKALEW